MSLARSRCHAWRSPSRRRRWSSGSSPTARPCASTSRSRRWKPTRPRSRSSPTARACCGTAARSARPCWWATCWARIESAGAAAGTAAPAAATAATAAPAPAAIAGPAATPRAEGAATLSPAVRRLVEEHASIPAAITGSGPGGRLLKEDVLRARRARGPLRAPAAARATPAVPATTAPAAPARRPRRRCRPRPARTPAWRRASASCP